MPVFVSFIFLAALLYTIAIGAEQYKKKLEKWMTMVFAMALICDLTGTTMMALKTTSHSFCIHTVCGYGALIVMIVHFVFAIKAFKHNKYQVLFTRYSWVAWLVWMTAFLSGILFR